MSSTNQSATNSQAESNKAKVNSDQNSAELDSAVNINAQVPNTEAASLQAANQELLSDLQRTRADFENFRKQVDLQKQQVKAQSTAATVFKFLSLIDDLHRAIAAHPTELSPIAKTFEKTLQSLELALIDTRPGVDFNPDFHEAVSMDEGQGEREVIAETLRPGYLYQGQVLRAAMVRVKRV
ncbi:MAG: nucleotide exchange factor GrpE [Candidatus Saccharibacteria bacterium]|nr:nucleotide exchange factor GrpE [Candidatus Saccharibacteria bacterium]